MKKFILSVATAIAMAIASPIATMAQAQATTEQTTTAKQVVNLAYAKKTSVTFTARNGQTFPVYVSRNGKAFVVRTSAKTGNEYRYYNLPEDIKQQAINEVSNK